MPRIIRFPKPGSAFYVPKNRFRTTVYFCYSYKELKQELKELSLLRSPQLTGLPRASDLSDPTAKEAMRASELKRKISIIEDTVRACSGDVLYPFMLAGVTEEGVTWVTQISRKIPANEKEYFLLRRKIYYEISKRI